MFRRRKKYQLTFANDKKKITPALIKEILSWVFYTAVVIFAAAIVVIAFGTRISVIGDSMEPSLSSGQYILVNKVDYILFSPAKDDIIAFLPNGNKNSHEYIKRIVAIPGDTVQIVDGELYINGALEDTSNEDFDKMEDAGIASDLITLGDDEYFVLGDNRNSSEDSRSANIGVVKKSTIIGKAWYCYGQGSNSGFIN